MRGEDCRSNPRPPAQPGMMRRPLSMSVDLGREPPLNASVHASTAFGRRVVTFRWLAATVLLAGAAGLLLTGALCTTVGQRVRFVAAPLFVRPRLSRQAVVENGRGDIQFRHVGRKAGQGSPIRIEQLSNSGFVRPFTLVSARLDEVDDGDAADDGPRSDPPVTGAPDKRRVAEALPPEILFGTSRPHLPSQVSAYAEDEIPLTASAPIGQPINVTIAPKSPEQAENSRRMVVARAGDTLSSILQALGATLEEAQAIASAVPGWSWLGGDAFAGGEAITVLEDAPSAVSVAPRILKVAIDRPNGRTVAVARSDAGRYLPVTAEQADAGAEGADATTTGDAVNLRPTSDETLRDSLNALARSDHLDQAVVAELVRLCGHDFDLGAPVGTTDMVDLLSAPDDLGQPELVFVALTAEGQSRRYYRFTAPDDGSTDYYDAGGRSITKFLLRKPVVSGRLGDGFGWRIHPILLDRRFHEGVDYAAPYGSPIAAAGAGVVEFIGQEWGYGKYIRIRHDLGYETTYAHVSGFPNRLKVGDRVRQGETIAYVGSTGLSTGPHLYYEVRINGHNVDPLRISLSDGRVLKGAILESFSQARDRIDQLIAATPIAASER
jgi:murein DD-endopeptidase MepM/ murein hydrolase activator NlpD